MSPVDRFAICPATNMEVASIKILEWPEGRSLHRWKFELTISGFQYQRRLLLPQERHARLLEGFCQLISAMVCLKRF